MSYEWDDINELEADIYSKDYKTPQQIMDHKFNVVHNRNWKTFLNSIEWDGLWLRHDTEEEREERRIQKELENHPFKQWF